MSNAIEYQEYTRHLKARGLRPASVEAYVGWVRRWQKWIDKPLRSATAADLERWLAAQSWSANTHNKAVQSVKYFYAWMRDTGRIEVDPTEKLQPARVPRPGPKPVP